MLKAHTGQQESHISTHRELFNVDSRGRSVGGMFHQRPSAESLKIRYISPSCFLSGLDYEV